MELGNNTTNTNSLATENTITEEETNNTTSSSQNISDTTEKKTNKESETESVKNSSTENSIYSTIENDKLGEIKYTYQTKNEIIENMTAVYDESGTKYALVDVDNDGKDDLLFYGVKENTFTLFLYKGTSKGFYMVDTVVSNAHKEHNTVIKEKNTSYLTIAYVHAGEESIEHIYMIDNGVVKKKVLNQSSENYKSEKLTNTINWKNV